MSTFCISLPVFPRAFLSSETRIYKEACILDNFTFYEAADSYSPNLNYVVKLVLSDVCNVLFRCTNFSALKALILSRFCTFCVSSLSVGSCSVITVIALIRNHRLHRYHYHHPSLLIRFTFKTCGERRRSQSTTVRQTSSSRRSTLQQVHVRPPRLLRSWSDNLELSHRQSA